MPARSRARPATALRGAPRATCSATARINALVRDLDLPVPPGECSGEPWDREAVHQLFDTLEFRVLRDRLLPVPDGGRAGGRGRLRAAGGGSRARRAARLARPSTFAAGTGRDGGPTGTAAGRRAPARCSRRSSRWPRGRRRGGLGRRRRARPRTTRRHWPAGWPTRRAPRRCTTPRGRCWPSAARGWDLAGLTSDTQLAAYLARPDQRTYDLADLALRYLQAGAEGGDGAGRRPARPWPDFGDEDSGAARPPMPPWSVPGQSSTWRTRSTRSWQTAAAPSCCPASSCRCSARWPNGEDRRRGRPRLLCTSWSLISRAR